MTTPHRPTRRVVMLRSDERARDRATHRMFAERASAPDPVEARLLAKWLRAQLRQQTAGIRISRQSAERCAALLEGAASFLDRGNR